MRPRTVQPDELRSETTPIWRSAPKGNSPPLRRARCFSKKVAVLGAISPKISCPERRRSEEGSKLVHFMVIETFRNQDAKSVYRRFREKGRMLPEGLTFVESFVTADLSRCFH